LCVGLPLRSLWRRDVSGQSIVKKILLGTIVSILSLGTVIIGGYFVVNKCRHSPSLQQADNQPTVISSSSPLRASTQIYLDTSTEDIFDYISNASLLPQWMPGLTSVTYDHSESTFPGLLNQGSRRTLMFGDQEETEIITQYEYPNIIAYQITAGVLLKNHLAVMTVVPDKAEGSLLTWYQYFDLERSSLSGWLMPFFVRRFLNDAQAQLIDQFGGEVVTACEYSLL
ncbi:MAG: SRPBCC family protein, partial [Cyanobacteria bacterium P01_F01_bin.116]